MDYREPLTAGGVITGENETGLAEILFEAFPNSQVRESSHYISGRYILIDFESEVEFYFERVNNVEYLVRGECGTSQAQAVAAEAIASHLGRRGFKCRFETYDCDDTLVSYSHHDWPIQVKANKSE